jgi:hypothetical protein
MAVTFNADGNLYASQGGSFAAGALKVLKSLNRSDIALAGTCDGASRPAAT